MKIPAADDPDLIKYLTHSKLFVSITNMTGQFERLLRRHGMQVTAQRLAIMRAVSARPHATVDVLAEDVRAILGAISRQAVYDALGVLVDKNLIRRIQPAGSAARYEDRVGDNHHHLICRGCGTVYDIDCAVGAVPCLTVNDDHGFEIDEAEVIYWGHCPSCRKAAAAAEAGKQAALSEPSGKSIRGGTTGARQK